MEVKDGRGTTFWLDRWCSPVPLGVLFSDVFSLAKDSAGPVRSHWTRNGWNLQLFNLTLLHHWGHWEEFFQLLPENLTQMEGSRD